MLFLAGCSQNNTTVKLSLGTDPNQIIELHGQAAEQYAAKVIEIQTANMQTAQGRTNQAIDSLIKLTPWFLVVLVGGGVFTYLTRSKWAAAIPIGAAIGLGLIFSFAAWADYIKWGMLIALIGLIIWRAAVYQRERDKLFGATNGTINRQNSIIANAQVNAISSKSDAG